MFSTTSEAQCDHIAAELTKLKEAGLTANIKKCQWGKISVEFLGHIVGQGQVKPSVCKEDKALCTAYHQETALVVSGTHRILPQIYFTICGTLLSSNRGNT